MLATDPFRIVSDEQAMVHLRLRVGGYNELVERFPLSKAYIQEDAEEEGIYDFQCRVNRKFYGLTNFILGFHHQVVEVLEPEELKEHLREEVKFFFPSDEEASSLITETLRNKLEKAGMGSLSVTARFDESYRNVKTKLVTYKGIQNKASFCPVILEGDPQAIAFAWKVGIGNSTGIGFGALK